MKIGALGLLLVLAAGAAFGFFALGTMMSRDAPVDSMGNTVTAAVNNTQNVVVSLSDGVLASFAVMTVLIISVLILIGVILYFAAAGRH